MVAGLASSEVRMRHGDRGSVSSELEAWPGSAVEPPPCEPDRAGVKPRSRADDDVGWFGDSLRWNGRDRGDPNKSRKAG